MNWDSASAGSEAVNTDAQYHEDSAEASHARGGRAVPSRVRAV
jgi:hypothetical protein